MPAANKAQWHDINHTPVLVCEDKTLPLVWFTLATRWGALGHAEGVMGSTRACWELMWRGTTKHSREQFSGALERLGTQISASAGHELALVRGVALRRHAKESLALVAEALLTPALADDERVPLLEEMSESLRNERDEDGSLADEMTRRALYQGHALAKPASGLPEPLLKLTRKDLSAAHEAHVRQDNLVGAIAGAANLADTSEWLSPLLGSLPKHPRAAVTLQPMSAPSQLRFVVVDKPERTQVQLRVSMLGVPWMHDDAMALWLGVAAFGGTFTSPLCREVRDKRGWSYVAHAEFSRRRRTPSAVVLRSAPALADAVDCIALEVEMLANFAQGNLESEAFGLTRDYLQNRHPFEVQTADDLLLPAVQNYLCGKPKDDLWDLPKQLTMLDADTVSSAVKRQLSGQQPLVVLVASADTVVPEIQKRWPKAKLDVVGYSDDAALL